ncbi:MAG: hypothetical protein M1833_002985 [Piccolia ochrophora]|nr:MAG: hypothetical protein M1833_002985 [Piccolia ochrophora]
MAAETQRHVNLPPRSHERPPSPSVSSRPVYRFGDDGGDRYRPSEFSFRQGVDSYRPQPDFDLGPRSYDQDKSRRTHDKWRGRGPPRAYQHPSSRPRPLLATQRQATPERLAGMGEREVTARRFMSVEDVSDSDEQDMEVDLDSDVEITGVRTAVNESHRELEGPPRKRQALDVKDSQLEDGDSKPKWSNPDLTVIPPVDETSKKRTDVVKLIRKARITGEKDDSAGKETSNDFISLDFDEPTAPLGVAGAPSGPKSFRLHGHVHELPTHGAHGTSGTLSAHEPGRPPSPRQETVLKEIMSMTNSAADPNLGSRKRTYEDTIKERPAPQQRKKKAAPDGEILPEWKPRVSKGSTPWCDVDHFATQQMGFWLHKELCDFDAYVKPREFEDIIRNDLVQRLRDAIARDVRYRDCKIHCFGSYAAGLYLPNADMDLVLVSEYYSVTGRSKLVTTNSFYFRFANFLMNCGILEPGSQEIISKAKVPLVKFRDKLTGLKVDMSFENTTGLPTNFTYQIWKGLYPMMPPLVSVIKQFLLMRGLNEPVNGGVGGFTVACLVTSLLQMTPSVQSGSQGYSLGDLLMDFFDFYGNEFNYQRIAIQLNPPGYLDKARSNCIIPEDLPYRVKNLDRLSIVDPNKPDNDISGGSHNIDAIFKTFSLAGKTLKENMARLNEVEIPQRRGESLLECILGGDYESFDSQRRQLLDAYTHIFGPTDPDKRITRT